MKSFVIFATRPRQNLIEIESQNVCAWRLAIGNAMLRNHLVDRARFDV
jgi:hypothetical protein